ncbi:MAG: hypothetical protein GTO49_18800, partial [Anaerolineae bacterium]|nr:hypothetical protein [Anaerolineae bacterium]
IKQWGLTFVGAPWFWDAMSYQKGGFLFKNSQESMLDDPIHAESWQFVLDLV